MISQATAKSRTPQARVLIGAFLLLALVLTGVMVISEEISRPLAVVAVTSVVLAGAISRWSEKRWLFVVASVLAALQLAGIISFGSGDLAHPETLLSFFPALATIVTMSVALVAGVAGATGRAQSASVIIAGGGVALMVVALAVSLIATLSLDDDAQAQGDAVIVAEDIEFPETVSLRAGESGIFIRNKDRTRHTFVIEGMDVKLELPGSTNRRLELNLPAGEYRYYCDVPGHERMEGTLAVF